MNRTSSSLASLAGDTGGATVTRPPARWVLRFVVPLVIVLGAMALLAYAARDAMMPVVDVTVAPVVTKDAATNGATENETDSVAQPAREPVIVAQAPGWIEPDPYAVTVQSLVAGVVDEVLVLEGDAVSRGDVIARLIDEDAVLALRRAEATLQERIVAVQQAEADIGGAESRLAELDDEVERKRELVEAGGVSPGEFARLKFRLAGQRSDLDAARAAHRLAQAAVTQQEVVVDEAALALERTVIRAPIDGVVLTRIIVPGTRVAMAGRGPGEQHFSGLVELYDPQRLQVRADVPLADAAKVHVGTHARITTDATPDQTFTGEVTRIVHRADIQRNTVEVKVRIDDPIAVLKPDMIARVRFVDGVGNGAAQPASGDGRSQREGSLRVFVTEQALHNRSSDSAMVWVLQPGESNRGHEAYQREVALGSADEQGMVRVLEGLRPGDRVIVSDVSSLQPGARVRPNFDEGGSNAVH